MDMGLRRGQVELIPHRREWDTLAQEAVRALREALGDIVVDIQHVGSTAIPLICAKPIIDIAVGVHDVQGVVEHAPQLEHHGFILRGQDVPNQLLFVVGDFARDTRTHHVHVVEYGGPAWRDYLDFRDYLRSFPEKAREYEACKLRLAARFSHERARYTQGKQDTIDALLAEARHWRRLSGHDGEFCVQRRPT